MRRILASSNHFELAISKGGMIARRLKANVLMLPQTFDFKLHSGSNIYPDIQKSFLAKETTDKHESCVDTYWSKNKHWSFSFSSYKSLFIPENKRHFLVFSYFVPLLLYFRLRFLLKTSFGAVSLCYYNWKNI